MMVCFLIFYIVYLIINAFENYYRDQEKFSMNDMQIARSYQRKWKRCQFIRWTIVFITVGYLLVNLGIPLLRVVSIMLLVGLLWTYLYDGIINLLKNRDFFYVSNQTESVVEKRISVYLRHNKWIALSIIIITTLLVLVIIFGG